MTIEDKDYRLTPSTNDAANFWDLELLVTIKPKGATVGRQEFKLVGYGMPLESCLRRIINYRIIHKHGADSITLEQYMKEFNRLLKELRDSVLGNPSKSQLLE